MSTRVNAQSPVERAIDELAKREREIVSALAAPTDKSEFAYGRLCGQYQESLYSRSLLEHCLNEGDSAEAERQR